VGSVASYGPDHGDQSLNLDILASCACVSQGLSEMLADGGYDDESAELLRAIARGDYRLADRLAKALLARLSEDAR
jgi:hypothetical protein